MIARAIRKCAREELRAEQLFRRVFKSVPLNPEWYTADAIEHMIEGRQKTSMKIAKIHEYTQMSDKRLRAVAWTGEWIDDLYT